MKIYTNSINPIALSHCSAYNTTASSFIYVYLYLRRNEAFIFSFSLFMKYTLHRSAPQRVYIYKRAAARTCTNIGMIFYIVTAGRVCVFIFSPTRVLPLEAALYIPSRRTGRRAHENDIIKRKKNKKDYIHTNIIICRMSL